MNVDSDCVRLYTEDILSEGGNKAADYKSIEPDCEIWICRECGHIYIENPVFNHHLRSIALGEYVRDIYRYYESEESAAEYQKIAKKARREQNKNN